MADCAFSPRDRDPFHEKIILRTLRRHIGRVFVPFPSTFVEISRMIARSFVAACFLFLSLAGAAQAESGIASVYAYEGGRTASGQRANPHELTAAHRTLPFGTRVRVTNKRNGRSVTVRINDRGPFVRGRIIDVTPAAAQQLGFSGLAPVTVEQTM
jgi:rare lipoprotein A